MNVLVQVNDFLQHIYQKLLFRDNPESVNEHYNGPTPHMDVSSEYSKKINLDEFYDLVCTVLKERRSLQSEVEELQSMLGAARRERVLAYDERDKILRSHHLCKMSAERAEATLQLIECEKEKLVHSCSELEKENVSLKKSCEESQSLKQIALSERTKLIEERCLLQENLKRLQEEREELFERSFALDQKLQNSSEELQKVTKCLQCCISSVRRWEQLGKSLKMQNEVLCGKNCIALNVTLRRTLFSQQWGFSIDGGIDIPYISGDPSIFITGITPNSPASECLRFGDRIVKIYDITVKGMARDEVGRVLHDTQKELLLELRVVRMCTHEPVPMKVYLPPSTISKTKSLEFDYTTEFIVSSSKEGSPLEPGDRIVKVKDECVLGMRTSQFRKLLQSFHKGLTLEITRTPSVFLSL